MCVCVCVCVCVCTYVEASTDISPIMVATDGDVVVPVGVNLVCFDIITCSGSPRQRYCTFTLTTVLNKALLFSPFSCHHFKWCVGLSGVFLL